MPRESEVLRLFAAGLRVRQIARRLGVSIHTGRAHLKGGHAQVRRALADRAGRAAAHLVRFLTAGSTRRQPQSGAATGL